MYYYYVYFIYVSLCVDGDSSHFFFKPEYVRVHVSPNQPGWLNVPIEKWALWNNPMLYFHSCNFRECEVPFHYNYSLFHSGITSVVVPIRVPALAQIEIFNHILEWMTS